MILKELYIYSVKNGKLRIFYNKNRHYISPKTKKQLVKDFHTLENYKKNFKNKTKQTNSFIGIKLFIFILFIIILIKLIF